MAFRRATALRQAPAWCSRRTERPLHTSAGKKPWDVVVVGGGHNGLVAAAYLAKSGRSVLVLEQRHVVGGAAVTEEVIPGYKFSRASYLKSLFRLDIEKDLELHRHGLRVYPRNPSSFTPLLDGRSLILGGDAKANAEQIAQFSKRDSEQFEEYETWLSDVVSLVDPMLDEVVVDPAARLQGTLSQKAKYVYQSGRSLLGLAGRTFAMEGDMPSAYELLTAPATKILDRWFESDVLKATLATDAVIGAMISPGTPGSGYVLLHHVMGRAMDGAPLGTWAYVEGGMGALSEAIARAAKEAGAQIETNAAVKQMLVNKAGSVQGVELSDGTKIEAKQVVSNLTPKLTFESLLPSSSLPRAFLDRVKGIDYTSPVMKINVALKGLPKFAAKALPYPADKSAAPDPGHPYHRCTIHMGCSTMEEIDRACLHAKYHHEPSQLPVIEMTLPSTLDPTLAPPGHHVASLFCQYVPYNPAPHDKEYSNGWERPGTVERCVGSFMDVIERYCPGFKDLVVGYDALTPYALEKVFGLTGGNIFHGAMSLDQLYWLRPATGYTGHQTPIAGLYLCGSGSHPGGGVMGAPGRNCAKAMM